MLSGRLEHAVAHALVGVRDCMICFVCLLVTFSRARAFCNDSHLLTMKRRTNSNAGYRPCVQDNAEVQ